MPVQISQFRDIGVVNGKEIQLPGSPPVLVNTVTSGNFVLAGSTKLIRIHPQGAAHTITWPGVVTPEYFDTPEYRIVKGGEEITITAVP